MECENSVQRISRNTITGVRKQMWERACSRI
eukprot:ctg_6585.g491